MPESSGPAKLLVFARCPELGKVKTRLVPALGEEGASELHRRMIVRTLETAASFAFSRGVDTELWYDGKAVDELRCIASVHTALKPQPPGDLGERMSVALAASFQEGSERSVLIGTDCPRLSVGILQRAFDALEHVDVVLGPAEDGGYYLIGARSSIPASQLARLFAGVAWGTGEVLADTLAAAAREALTCELLETLADVDRPEDLGTWEDATGEQASGNVQGSISVIVPALNEAAHLSRALSSARAEGIHELIVVDGGSSDGTADLAESDGAKVIRTHSGRAHQMNIGAAAARCEILLFLHADTQLPSSFPTHVRRILELPGTAAGAFSFGVSPPFRGSRLLQRLVNWRSRRLQMPYGDQTLFLKAEMFAKVGGFPELPIMEDLELVRRLKRFGRIRTAPVQVTTSSRRWTSLGVWRTTLVNQLCIAAYYLKIPPSAIARLYARPGELHRT